MILFEYINTNIDRIKYDTQIGLISTSFLKYWAIYSRYDYYRKSGHRVSEAVAATSANYKVAESWIYEIIKKMEVKV